MDFESFLIKARLGYQKNRPTINAYVKRRYPEFVFSSRPQALKDEIPVFVFHSVYPEEFERQLQFLSQNYYQTITADEYLQAILGIIPVPDKAILLTFDDGLGSLWTYAYPLLKKYKMHGVSFIVTGMIEEGDGCLPNLEDLWSSIVSAEHLAQRENSQVPLCTWAEIRQMASDGVIEFQSHTMYHSRIFTQSRIVDFFNPSFDTYALNLNVPVFSYSGHDAISRNAELGMPIYLNEPRLGGSLRYFDDEQLRAQCIDFVREHGGADFFETSNWRKQLKKVVARYTHESRENGYFEDPGEQKYSIRQDLRMSKYIIEQKLPGTVIRHFCYPFYVGSDLGVEISKETGYLANYWGILDDKRTNKPGDDPFFTIRLTDDLIFRLPGGGRKRLSAILAKRTIGDIRRFFPKLRKSKQS